MGRIARCTFAVLLALLATGARADLLQFDGAMTGTQESPSNGSNATGFASIDVDTLLQLLTVDVIWAGLTGGPPGAAHIHCCTVPGTNVGVAVGFPGFPATLAGTYNHVFDLTDADIYTSGFLNNFGGGTAAGASAALIAGLADHQAYVNIHNATFPGGEIRAQVAQVSEPVSLGLALLGLALLASIRRGAGSSRPRLRFQPN